MISFAERAKPSASILAARNGCGGRWTAAGRIPRGRPGDRGRAGLPTGPRSPGRRGRAGSWRSRLVPARIVGIGVGCTGPVSAERGIINNPTRCPPGSIAISWANFPIALPGRIWRTTPTRPPWARSSPARRGCSSIVMLTLGTGVGGGVILDGSVYRGAQGEHPELGHMPVDPAGPACYCGTQRLPGIDGPRARAIAEAGRSAGFSDSREVFARGSAGDPAAGAILDKFVRLWRARPGLCCTRFCRT